MVIESLLMDKQSEVNGVSIIIPAYNEQQAIGDVLKRLNQVMGKSRFQYEIIVVDDGSEDNTVEIAKKVKCVNVLSHKSNRGYGAAIKTGACHAQYNLICITDADGTYPNDKIPDMIENLVNGKYDMVVGARIGDNVAIPFIRRPAKWFIGKIANLVAGEVIPDINSGLRLIKRSLLMRFYHLLPDSFSLTTTITLAMVVNGYLIDFIQIGYYPRIGKSKIKPVRDTLNFVLLILRIALYFAPLKIFLPLSMFFLFIAVIWGVLSRLILGHLADISTLVMVITAIQIAVVGLLAELIDRRLPNYYKDE